MGEERGMFERLWWTYAATKAAISEYVPDLYTWRSKRVLKEKKVTADAKVVVWVHPPGTEVGEANILPETCTLGVLPTGPETELEELADKELTDTIPSGIAHIELALGKYEWLKADKHVPLQNHYIALEEHDTVLLDAFSGDVLERKPVADMPAAEFIRSVKKRPEVTNLDILMFEKEHQERLDLLEAKGTILTYLSLPKERVFDMQCTTIHRALERSVNNLKGGAVSCVATKSYGFLTPHVQTFNSLT